MPHQEASRLLSPQMTENPAYIVQDVLSSLLEEIDMSRNAWGGDAGIEDRLDRLELCVVALAAHLKNVGAT